MRARAWIGRYLVSSVLVVVATAPAVEAQLRLEPIASGLSAPVGFVQDPSDPTVQYIVEQGGRIRALKSGVLQSGDFLNLSASIVTNGEQGLLGLAFPPDYGSSGRFYVYFTRAPDGHIVVARFLRSSNPLVANAASRFDLRWSDGQEFIPHQGATNHNGGRDAFGPDGYLYIAVGDGGGSGDPNNNAQNPAQLLGKMLRIDVNVPTSNPNGFVVPASNPFVGVTGTRPEIWSFGLRNPWQFSFDAGTGGLWIADVGQGAWEEVDYEPPAQGGRNYGWPIFEGTHVFDSTRPIAFQPLTSPVHEYSHAVGRSITGGVAYYGRALGPSFAGRYFFADFITRRVWSVARTSDTSVGDLREHSVELGGGAAYGNISAFGVDAAGEIYIVSWSLGQVFRLGSAPPVLQLDSATAAGEVIDVFGWTLDRRATDSSGIDTVHVYAFPNPGSGLPPIFVGFQNAPFDSRPDVAAIFGAQFARSGFRIQRLGDLWLPPAPTLFVAYARSSITGEFEALGTFFQPSVFTSGVRAALDRVPSGAMTQPIAIAGWALDPVVASAPPSLGTGIEAVVVDVHRTTASGASVFVQSVPASYGLRRPDVAAIFGSRFQDSGFHADLADLSPGSYRYEVRSWMTGANRWRLLTSGSFSLLPGPILTIDAPTSNQIVTSPFVIGGWVLDLRTTDGSTGIDAVHVWAYKDPGSGTPPVFLGVADYGASRPDVAAAFGVPFRDSGFNLRVGGLATGEYSIVVFARSTVTATFDIHRIVRVTVE